MCSFVSIGMECCEASQFDVNEIFVGFGLCLSLCLGYDVGIHVDERDASIFFGMKNVDFYWTMDIDTLFVLLVAKSLYVRRVIVLFYGMF